MKKNLDGKSGFITLRNLFGVLLGIVGLSLATFSMAAKPAKSGSQTKQEALFRPIHPVAGPVVPSAGPSPTSGTLSRSSPLLTFADPIGPVPNATGEGVTSGAPTCAANGVDCSNYTVTLDPSIFTAATGYDPNKAFILIQLNWTPTAYEYGSFVEDKNGNVIASNTAGTDPETISIPVNSPGLQAGGPYTIVTTLEIGTPGLGYTGNISLQQPKGAGNSCTSCQPPRYQMYFGPDNASGEPSVGVDWNPNVASFQQVAAGNVAHGPTLLDTGGVSFFTANLNQYRVTFDDCSSPAINTWTNVTFPTEGVTTLDPIGFTDHFISGQLGTSYPPPKTNGRVWQTQLSGVSSISAYSDDDGGSWTPTEGGGPPTGPDHETDGAGPYNPNAIPPPPPATVYSNAFYYCSQNIAGDAECSRSDDGGLTFGPGVPIFQNLSECVGGIHGHVKVASDGTVYVPNFACSVAGVGNQGNAVSTDNGITWTENNVTGSGSPKSTSSVDPQMAVALNSIGRPAGQTTPTIYFAYNDQDGTLKASASHDRGLTWTTPVDVGAPFAIVNSTFPTVVAGDDNRAAVGFLGTTSGGDGNSDNATCSTFTGIWHMYIATTYDGGNTWTTIDATPDSPVQVGPICRGGTFCPGYRNLLDFIVADVDSQGRGEFAIAHGCPNCPNVGATCGSNNALSAIFRQSGGPRLFSFFDNQPQAAGAWAPANPQALSATVESNGVQIAWLEPDNGGSPITGYKIYRGTTSGGETFLATVSNSPANTQTKYLDTTAKGTSYYYHVTAVNAIGESGFCEELSPSIGAPTGTPCAAPFVQMDGAGNKATEATSAQTIQSVNIGEPFTSCTDNSITFVMKVPTLDPAVYTGTGTDTGQALPPPNTEYQILFNVTDTNGNPETIYVSMDTNCPEGVSVVPEFSYGRRDPSATGGTFDDGICTAQPGNPLASCPQITGTYTADGTITIKLDVSQPISFPANTGAASGAGGAFTWDGRAPGTKLGSVNGSITLFAGCGAGLLESLSASSGGDYIRVGNLSCSSKIPVAGLTAIPLSGNAPMNVTFDASTSHEPTGACGTINSYTLDFGDGSTPVTQSSPSFSHTYSATGSYPATLTVKDTSGLTSDNLAQVVITVNSAGAPALAAVKPIVSRMTHGSVGTFDINLPVSGTRGIECRRGVNGVYHMVFTFANNLASVGSATITNGGPASVSGSSIGPNPNQYTVNLTGVPDAQVLQVTLINAKDSTGAIGNVTGTMDVLIGDTNADGFTDAVDVSQTKSQSGNAVTSSNFREDVNADGFIDAVDVSLVKSESGTALP
jgi:PKD domain/Fibronectin type III domain/Dockerin type I domain